MSQSPSKTEVRKARISKEEQIVQRIVELLNEKGYEYERDARPLICWKYNVNSSRDLTMEQKEEVKNALENGTFQKWGEEYKNQVLSNQIDVVKQIEQMASAPEALISTKIADQSDVKKQDKKSDSSVKKSTTSTAKKDVEEKIEAKSDILLSPKTKDKEASGKPQKLVESSNIKIEKLDKPSASVPKINLKMPAESV
ncbi:hypothetical protein KDK77_09660, partial [bacterium]|nr:hypothetical protein [bacterium]